MKLKKWEEEMSVSLKKILLVEMLEGLEKSSKVIKEAKVMILMKHKKLYPI